METLHDRTPLMLTAPLLGDWLHSSTDAASALALAAPLPSLAWHAVSRAVGSVRNRGPQLIAPLG